MAIATTTSVSCATWCSHLVILFVFTSKSRLWVELKKERHTELAIGKAWSLTWKSIDKKSIKNVIDEI